MANGDLPYIPNLITVHLGKPDQEAQNVQVSFPDYIKNVASSEIYPTWPESAIRANGTAVKVMILILPILLNTIRHLSMDVIFMIISVE